MEKIKLLDSESSFDYIKDLEDLNNDELDFLDDLWDVEDDEFHEIED